MIKDVKLRLTKIIETEMETKEGLIKKETFVFKGRDPEVAVDWTLTLRVEEEMPPDYVKQLGKRIGNEVPVSFGKVTEQAEL